MTSFSSSATDKPKFTAGPWEIIHEGMDIMVSAPSDIVVDPSIGLHASANDLANAHLIAAAPELYEAAAQALDYVGARIPDPNGVAVFNALRSALSKARGEQS